MRSSSGAQYKEYPYRYAILLIFVFLTFVNGMCWVVVSPISVQIGKAYDQSDAVVSLIPMSYMIVYVFVNFPSNWVLDVKGVRKGIIIGAVLTCVGAAFRCFVTTHFAFVILGQIICAIGQPFILNAPTKIAVRWFLPQSRSVALAILSVSNIVGTAAGFIIPPLFVDSDSPDRIRDQFFYLLIAQFLLSVLSMALTLLRFKQRPPTPASAGSQAQNTEYYAGIKKLFKDRKFLTMCFSFGTVLGSFNIYGSLLDNIFDCYGYTPDEVSYLGAIMMLMGIVSAGLFGLYIQKTLKYRKVFIVLGILGVVQCVSMPMVLGLIGYNFWIAAFISLLQGIIFIPLMPLSFDYTCDILFPAGEAQITGCLMASGNLFGAIYIIISQQIFKLGQPSNTDEQNKAASLSSVIMVSSITIAGVILYFFFNSELKRSKLQREKSSVSLLSST